MTSTGGIGACPSCEASLPPDSQFCPECGIRLAAGETIEMSLPVRPDPNVSSAPPASSAPPVFHQAHRRPFGAHPVPVLGALGGGSFLLGIVLLVVGVVVPGLVLIVLAVGLLALFAGGVRREPDAPAAEATLHAAGRTRSLTALVALSSRAWIRAARDLLRIRHRQHQLRSELDASLAPLGEAVHKDDRERAEALKQRAAEIEEKLNETEREASAVVAGARAEVEQERSAIESTRAHRAQTELSHGPNSR